MIKPKQKLIGYHGTGGRFRKFNLKYSTQGIIWFTSNKQEVLDGNVGAQGRGFIITAQITMQNPAGWDEYHKKSIGELQRDGYDGVILDSTEDNNVDYFVWNTKQIKILKINEFGAAWKADWMRRRNIQLDSLGRLPAYHGTPTKNLKSIKENGFRSGTYFSLKSEYSKQIASTYHNTPINRITVLEVSLPLDAIDFVGPDIVSTRVIKLEETQ
jgi:hypothetical protein